MINALPFLLLAAAPVQAAPISAPIAAPAPAGQAETPRGNSRSVAVATAVIIRAEVISSTLPKDSAQHSDRQYRKSGDKMIVEFY